MPKYWLVKIFLARSVVSGSGVTESLALDHAPFTIIVSFGTTFAGSGLVTLEKSPPLCVTGGTGAAGAVVPWRVLWPQARHDAKRESAITKRKILENIQRSPMTQAVRVGASLAMYFSAHCGAVVPHPVNLRLPAADFCRPHGTLL